MWDSCSQIGYSFTFLDAIVYATASSSPATSSQKDTARQLDDLSQASVTVETLPFRNLTGLLDNYKDYPVEIDDEDEEKDLSEPE